MLESLNAAQPVPMTRIKSIYDYVGDEQDIGNELLNFQNRMDIERHSYAFPTVFFINTTHREFFLHASYL